MKPRIALRRTALVATAALLWLSPARGEDVSSIKFSDPTKPTTLRVAIARGDVRITGADTDQVVVKTEVPPQNRPRKDGLRVLTESASFTLKEENNVVKLEIGPDGWVGAPADFDITLPRGSNVIVTSSLGSDIVCAGITGDVEIKSLHGEIRLDDLRGAAVVDNMNGEIVANVRELREGKALSFTSMNGQVVVRVPSDAKANVRLRTQNGTILTDFDDKALVTKVETLAGGRRRSNALPPQVREAVREAARAGALAAQHAAAAVREAAEAARQGANVSGADDEENGPPPVPPVAPVPPPIPTVTGGKLVSGVLNGGGPEISITTMNGDVTLRQLAR